MFKLYALAFAALEESTLAIGLDTAIIKGKSYRRGTFGALER